MKFELIHHISDGVIETCAFPAEFHSFDLAWASLRNYLSREIPLNTPTLSIDKINLSATFTIPDTIYGGGSFELRQAIN